MNNHMTDNNVIRYEISVTNKKFDTLHTVYVD